MTASTSGDDVRELVGRHGTPLYVYERDVIATRAAELRAVVRGASLYYSLKANPNREVAALLRTRGCLVEVASGGELDRAIEAGYDPAEIMFIGPGKTRREIIDAAHVGVGHFVVDNDTELSVLASETNVREIVVRVNPLFEASGAKLSMSGGKPKQFGVDRPQIAEFISLARAQGIEVVGLHYYLGTRYLNASDIVDNTRLIIDDAAEIARENSLSVRFLDMGGGFGVPYFPGEGALDVAVLERGLQACIQEANRIFPDATLAFESGRYLTAEAGSLLLTVLAKKTSYGTTFCVCDGGTNLNLAVIGTGSLGKRNFPSRVVSTTSSDDQTESEPATVTVTGPLCTPDDTILKSVEWDVRPRPGDIVVIERVGAYGPSASPHSFLGHRFPTEVLI